MRRLLNLIRRPVIMATITVSILAIAPVKAFAQAEYRVWVDHYDLIGSFSPGDISDGWVKLVPPAWACGLRFGDPSYRRWVNENGGTISSANLSKDVVAWIGKPGCLDSDVEVEYTDGSATFNQPNGAVYMEITTHYAVHWVDTNGHVPACTNCVAADTFLYLDPYEDDHLLSPIATLQMSLLVTGAQTQVPAALDAVAARLRSTALSLTNRVADRRRSYPQGIGHLSVNGDLELTVTSLEDAALRWMGQAGQDLGACQQQARAYQFSDAFVRCELAGDAIEAASRALVTAQAFLRGAARGSSGR